MKKIKSILSLMLVAALMLTSVCVVSADRSFSDLPSDHWSYSYVQKLVNDGTINGFTDGTFRPNATVSRAEFIKMIGKIEGATTRYFADVPSTHWAYDYIIHTDMDVSGNNFYPTDAITRNDVLKLLYKRAGSPKGIVAPGMITGQSDNPDAAAWAYVYGIMTGGEGVNLNLDSGLTRAEATALICRSRELNANSKKYSLTELVDEQVLSRVYNSFNLFGDTYTPDRTYTNGEIAKAFVMLACDQEHVTYDNILTGYSVDRENSFAFNSYCRSVIGEDKMTEKFYDEKATNINTVAALMFALKNKAMAPVERNHTDNYYPDVKTKLNKNMNRFLTGAYELGIRLDNNNNLKPNDPITAKNLALILLQFDYAAGFNTTHNMVVTGTYTTDESLRTSIYDYPGKSSDYKFVLKNVPNVVYDTPFVDENGKIVTTKPKDIFRVARDYHAPFVNMLKQAVDYAKELGASVSVSYYPSLVCQVKTGYVLRLKITVNTVDGTKNFSDVFASNLKEDFVLENGMTFYADLATGSNLQGTYMPIDNATFTQVIR